MACYLYVGNRPAFSSAAKAAGKKEQYGYAACSFNEESGEAREIETVYFDPDFSAGPAFIDSRRRRLYIANEVSDLPGQTLGGGYLYVCSIDPDTGRLSRIGGSPSYAAKPSYITSDESGRYLLITNHGGRGGITTTERGADGRLRIRVRQDESNVVLFPLDADGAIGEPADIFRLEGSGPKSFQHGPHAHSIVKAPGKNMYVVCDKGGDQIYTLSLDPDKGALKMLHEPLKRLPGSAPRYSAFHPSLPYLYVNKEAEPRISVFRVDDDLSLTEVQVVKNDIPEGFALPPEAQLFQSEILVSPDGENLYVFIRYINIASVYGIDRSDGTISLRRTVKLNGGPRTAAFSPDGKYLAVSLTEEHRVDIYAVAPDGLLTGPVSSLVQPSPGTVSFCRF